MEYLMRQKHNAATAVLPQSACKARKYFSSHSLSPSIVSALENLGMYLKTFIICICFLGGTLGSDQNLQDELKTCLSTVIEKLCPDCITLHLVIPTKSSWQADALADHFTDSSPIYASTIFTMDRPGFEDTLVDQVGLYLVNTAEDLKMGLKHLRRGKSDRNYIVWVNFRFGHSLDGYLKNVIPANWNRGNALGLIFVAFIGGDVQVSGTPIQKSGSYNVESLRKVSVCDTKALIETPQPIEKVIESREPALKVIIKPTLLPFVERQTDNPGGFIEDLIDALKGKLNFTPKYDWSYEVDDLPNLGKIHDLYIAFDLLAIPKILPPSSPVILMPEAFWVVVTKNPYEKRNILVMPFRSNISWHLLLLAIYTSVTVYVSRDFDKTRIISRLFGMFFGVSIGWWPRKRLFRFLVVLWCFTSYILVQAYLAALTTELSYPIIDKHFRDVEDLMESGIEIFCHQIMKDFYCNLSSNASMYICENCVVVDDIWFWHMYRDQLRMNKTWRPLAFHSNIFTSKSYFAGKPFNIMPVRIGMWPGIIYSNAEAPFLETVANISYRLLEAGIIEHWYSQYFLSNITEYEYEPEILSISHLKDMFIILYVGWSFSIVAFVIEILMKWHCSD